MTLKKKKQQRKMYLDFPGGTVNKNSPASAGDTGSVPGPGRSHMPQSNKSPGPQLLSPCSTAWELQLLKPPRILETMLHTKRSALTRTPCTNAPQLGKAHEATKAQHNQNKYID